MTEKEELREMLYLLWRAVTVALDDEGNTMKCVTILNNVSPSSVIFVLKKAIEYLDKED